MQMYTSLEFLLQYPIPKIPSYSTAEGNPDGEVKEGVSLEALIEEKVLCLTEILKQIQHDIVQRKSVSAHVLGDITRHYCYLKTKLLELYTWMLGGNRAIEHRRSSLEKQLDAFNQERRREEVESWKDIAVLKKEWRVWFKQSSDVMQRAKIILSDRISGK